MARRFAPSTPARNTIAQELARDLADEVYHLRVVAHAPGVATSSPTRGRGSQRLHRQLCQWSSKASCGQHVQSGRRPFGVPLCRRLGADPGKLLRRDQVKEQKQHLLRRARIVPAMRTRNTNQVVLSLPVVLWGVPLCRRAGMGGGGCLQRSAVNACMGQRVG